VSLGSVYKTLTRLEDKGLVRSRVGAPTPERGGRRKRHYRLQPTGSRALNAALRNLKAMTHGLAGGIEAL